MINFYEEFRTVIDTAKAHQPIAPNAALILMGRISYAVERGELSVREGDALIEMLEPGMKRRYAEALEVASFGDAENSIMPELTGIA